MRIDVTSATLQRTIAAIEAAGEAVPEEIGAAMDEAIALLTREAREATPTATGLSRASIIGESRVTPTGAIGETGSPLTHMAALELGAKPHMPPIEPIADWVRVKFAISDEREATSIAHAIARTIARRGTLAVGMFHRAWAAQRGAVETMFAAARDQVASRMAGPREAR